MDADERTARRIVNGVAGLIGLWLLAQFVPAFVAAVLMTGSFLVLLLALIGFARPSWVRLPNRLAGVWFVALSVGMFVGGGVLLNQNEDEISTANGTPTGEDTAATWQAELVERRAAIERTQGAAETARGMPEPERVVTPLIRTGENQASVTSATWTDGPWPFTVDSGVIGCVTVDAGPVLVFADTNGTIWPLNGLALIHAPRRGGQPRLDPIWRANPQIPGTRIPLGPMMDAARTLC